MNSNTSSPSGSSPVAVELRSLAEPLAAVVSGLEPRDVPLSLAPEVLAVFTEIERIASSGRVLMAARAAEAGQWQAERFASAAEWLADLLGTTAGRARADLETSERLAGLDATADAVRAGALSPEQAAAVADASAVNPAAEADLLDLARRESLRRIRQEAERRKAEARSEAEQAERDRRVRRERCARFWYSNGVGHVQAHGPVDAVKELEQLLQREVDRRFRATRVGGDREPRAAHAFDALIDAGRGAAGGSATPSSRAPVTRMTLIRVDLAALQRGQVERGEVCEIGGVTVSVTELRRLLGESVLQLVLTHGEAVVDVVNLSRRPTVAQKIAKLFTDSGCSVVGCDRAAVIEFDHRDDWARVKVTETANLDVLCTHHHDRKTLEGWQLVPGSGRRDMVPPTDPRHPGDVRQRGRPAGRDRPPGRSRPTTRGEGSRRDVADQPRLSGTG